MNNLIWSKYHKGLNLTICKFKIDNTLRPYYNYNYIQIRGNPIKLNELEDSINNNSFGLILYKHDNTIFQLLTKQLHDNLETMV